MQDNGKQHPAFPLRNLLALALSAGLMLAPHSGQAAPFIYTKSSNGTLSVVDLATNRVVDSIVYGGSSSSHYSAITAHQKTGDIYVGNRVDTSTDQVSVFDATTATATNTFGFPDFIDEAIAHKAMSKVYVMPFLKRVSVISASDQKILTTIPSTWAAADIDLGGSRLFGLQQEGWDYGFFVADTGTDTLSKEVTYPGALGDDQYIRIAAHPRGTLLYVLDYDYFLGGRLDVRDGTTLNVVASVNTSFDQPQEMKASPDGKTLAVRTLDQIVFLSLQDYSVLGTLAFDSPLDGVPVFSEDSKTLYTLGDDKLHIVDVVSRTLSKSISIGAGAVNLTLLNEIPGDTAGVTTGMTLSHFQCTNLTTGQVVGRDVVDRTDWNCDALDFKYSAGDSVQITVEGTRN